MKREAEDVKVDGNDLNAPGDENKAKRMKSSKKAKKSKKKNVPGTIKERGTVIKPNMKGFFVTCRKGKERQCVDEVLALFRHYASAEASNDDTKEEDGEKQIESPTEEISIEDDINKELAILQQQRTHFNGDAERKDRGSTLTPENLKFRQIYIQCSCVVFIESFVSMDPVDLTYKIVEDAQKNASKMTRYTDRLIPISKTCNAGLEDFEKLTKEIILPYLESEREKYGQSKMSYAIDVNIKHNSKFEKRDIITSIARVVTGLGSTKVDLNHFDYLILVHVYKSAGGLSIVKDFNKYKKFNLYKVFAAATSREGDNDESRGRGNGKSKIQSWSSNSKLGNANDEPLGQKIKSEETNFAEIRAEIGSINAQKNDDEKRNETGGYEDEDDFE